MCKVTQGLDLNLGYLTLSLTLAALRRKGAQRAERGPETDPVGLLINFQRACLPSSLPPGPALTGLRPLPLH